MNIDLIIETLKDWPNHLGKPTIKLCLKYLNFSSSTYSKFIVHNFKYKKIIDQLLEEAREKFRLSDYSKESIAYNKLKLFLEKELPIEILYINNIAKELKIYSITLHQYINTERFDDLRNIIIKHNNRMKNVYGIKDTSRNLGTKKSELKEEKVKIINDKINKISKSVFEDIYFEGETLYEYIVHNGFMEMRINRKNFKEMYRAVTVGKCKRGKLSKYEKEMSKLIFDKLKFDLYLPYIDNIIKEANEQILLLKNKEKSHN